MKLLLGYDSTQRRNSGDVRQAKKTPPKKETLRQSPPLASVKPKTNRQINKEQKTTINTKSADSAEDSRKQPLNPKRRIKSEPIRSPPREYRRTVRHESQSSARQYQTSPPTVTNESQGSARQHQISPPTVTAEHQFSDVESKLQNYTPNSPSPNSLSPPSKISKDISTTAHDKRSNFKFTTTLKEIKLDVKGDSFIKILVSAVVNPGLFYVHLVTPEAAKLDDLMDRMNACYDEKCKHTFIFPKLRSAFACQQFCYSN